jgi:hypothetical protein
LPNKKADDVSPASSVFPDFAECPRLPGFPAFEVSRA